jgi:hypothetical protein
MRRRIVARAIGLALVLAGGAGPAAAHHVFDAEFDPDEAVILSGVVVRVDWVNPHVWLYLTVDPPGIAAGRWKVQAAPPGVLAIAQGWRRDTIRPGVRVQIRGYRARDGSPAVHGLEVTLPDGRVLCANPPCAPAVARRGWSPRAPRAARRRPPV